MSEKRPALVLWASGLLFAWILSHFVDWPIRAVLSMLDRSVRLLDSGFLLVSATVLVGTNAFRAFMLYTGWFLLGQYFRDVDTPGSGRWIPLLGIPGSYVAAWAFRMPSVPHFGGPAVMALISVVMVQYLSRDVVRPGNRTIVLGTLVLSMQWLDVIPKLTDYGFGWGELSLAIKEVATLMDRDVVLDVVGAMSFVFSFAMALVITELFVGYEKRLAQLRLLRKRERELSKLRQDQTESRVYREMQYLVHDLKRPLTAVMGLSDVISQTSTDHMAIRHSDRIQGAASRMNQMISEIRDPMAVQVVSVSEVLDYSLSQIRPLEWSSALRLKVPEELRNRSIRVNLIRFSRALVNLLDNSHRATEGRSDPRIFFGVSESQDGNIVLFVRDNGPGFGDYIDKGGSRWGSSGLGLAFVRDVTDSHGWKFELGIGPDGGASVELSAPPFEDRSGKYEPLSGRG
ncbi:HAMP domain-containing histidine kinase [Dethiosulfovibrio sp. F2B]|uniref:sensor histidine kinase n=1 Tax=Dethiosulfovibrio faecalis TaxID=2720018 RepID=UPI001F28E6FF|nr:HAMP domain-containing sensor histidine kinase [Dethiosulfovibrio faecalis]MCF4151595.1 HAMP domain-containing histidine kinase [Dethiosulfovibrio faecalis]